MNIWLIAALWMGLALAAALGSVQFGISVALVEILLGFLAGNTFHLSSTPWIDFLAGSGSVLLTFLAGAEIDPDVLRTNLRESLTIGFFSFLAPAVGAFAAAYWVFGWNLHAAEIAGVVLSTTSVAVVYAVMVESGRNETELGKVILAACFVTDLGTVVALGLMFANYDRWLAVFVVVTALVVWGSPKFVNWFFQRLGSRVSEPEIKVVLLILFGLGGPGRPGAQRGRSARVSDWAGPCTAVPEEPRSGAPHARHPEWGFADRSTVPGQDGVERDRGLPVDAEVPLRKDQ